MTCMELAEFLMDYLDGELPAETRAVFDRHLGVCPECRHYLRSYEMTVTLTRSSVCDSGEPVAGPPPAELVAAILASRRAEKSAAPLDGQMGRGPTTDPA
ncbi:MAG: hypothetical protein AMXMBFR47_38680 [Planctomycetota bacterium]